MLKKEHPKAKLDRSIDTFKFIQPKGTLELLLQPPKQLGWTVYPEREPMEVCDCLLHYSYEQLYQ